MKVVVLHSEIAEDAPKDEQDVLMQVHAVSDALGDLGYDPLALPFSIDVRGTVGRLRAISPAFVLNLVETVEGTGRLIHMAPALLDHLGLHCTGASTESMFLTSNKLMAKRLLRQAGIPTPDWISLQEARDSILPREAPWIVKSVWEHASVGLDEDSVLGVLRVDETGRLLAEMEAKRDRLGGSCFAEVFIEGREFNLSILGGEGEPRVLPPAEIHFNGYPPEKARVVDYRAKWDEDSFEYNNTPRCFDFPDEDRDLLVRLAEIAGRCWQLFRLRGYARVDFRVDHSGTPWVLEVNANPCLSPDAGFAAAAEKAGLRFHQVVERIINDSIPLPYRLT